jgi:amino acid transporter
LYWNYSGFDAAGAYAGEIQNPKTTYPRAMVLTVVMIALTYRKLYNYLIYNLFAANNPATLYLSFCLCCSYIIPFFAISGVDKPHYTTWTDGSYTSIALGIGGTWLCVWVVISNLFGNLGMYVAEMTKDGFQLAGMADSGLAPSFFSVYVLPPLHCQLNFVFKC